MLRNIKLTIEYDGTHFSGWQIQSARKKSRQSTPHKARRTVQGEIEKALKKIFKHSLKLTGSGRTDSGVHAVGQAANFKTKSILPAEKIQNALNANLPADIAIVKVEDVPLNFHSQYSVKSKTYRYTILNRHARCSLWRDFCLFYPYKLNIRTMRKEAESFVGRKDFKSFAASDPAKIKKNKKENTTRTVKRVDISKKGEIITIDIEANGFLYKMVRNMVGTLLGIGSGRLANGSIKKILAQKDRRAAGNTAKPNGLTLLEVHY